METVDNVINELWQDSQCLDEVRRLMGNKSSINNIIGRQTSEDDLKYGDLPLQSKFYQKTINS